MPSIKLTYFGLRGRAELSRLILAAAGVPYEDNRITHAEWVAMKPTTPFGGLPILEYDGLEIAQSMAIARYLAKKCGLAGRNEDEQAQADMVVDHLEDAVSKVGSIVRSQTPAGKAAKIKEFVQFLPQFMEKTEKLLKKSDGEYFVGGKLTWADIFWARVLEGLKDESLYGVDSGDLKAALAKLDSDYPLLKDLSDRVNNQEGIKKWIETRPKTPM